MGQIINRGIEYGSGGGDTTALEARIAALETEVQALDARVTALENAPASGGTGFHTNVYQSSTSAHDYSLT